MKSNRSVPQATVIPILIYPDVREAVEWLSQAFGFQAGSCLLISHLTTGARGA